MLTRHHINFLKNIMNIYKIYLYGERYDTERALCSMFIRDYIASETDIIDSSISSFNILGKISDHEAFYYHILELIEG